MTLSNLASLGSFVSSVAVAVTRAFWLLQLRARPFGRTASSAMRTWLRDYNNVLLWISGEPEFARDMRCTSGSAWLWNESRAEPVPLLGPS